MKTTTGFTTLSIALVIAGCLSRQLSADNLTVVKEGKSDYQIVIPDKCSDEHAAEYIKQAAGLLRESILEATGADLPVKNEAAVDKSKPGLYIGGTERARKSGFYPDKFPDYECVIAASGADIILAGNDRLGVPDPGIRYYNYSRYHLWSVKAVTGFIEQQMGGRFLLPGKNGRSIPKSQALVVPGDLKTRVKVPIEFCLSRQKEIFYDIANNFFGCPEYFIYGGESYYTAVPLEKYGKTNPEYFAVTGEGGTRNTSMPHLCISNPDVQELIYKEMLSKLDMGYKGVELGSTDGYIKCHCPGCKKMFPFDDQPGEEIWVFHRMLAERMLKDRPDKKVLMWPPNYYAATVPPKTYKSFPPNVILGVETFGEFSLKENSFISRMKRDYDLPGGIMFFTQLWGDWHPMGYLPKFSPGLIERQVKFMIKTKVTGIYRMGFGELFGLEGPVYYVFGRMLNYPEGSGQAFANEFYRMAYGEAYKPMKVFFDTLHGRLELYGNEYFDRDPRIMAGYFYAPPVLDSLETNLSRAEKTAKDPKVKARLKLVRLEFDYLKDYAKAVHLYNAYLVNRTQPNFDQLAEAIAERKQHIAAMFDSKGNVNKLSEFPEIFPFNGGREGIYKNGRQGAAPFIWDFDKMKKYGILPGSENKSMTVVKAAVPVTMDGDLSQGAWKDLKEQALSDGNLGVPTKKTVFKVTCDDKNFYIGTETEMEPGREFTSQGKDGPCWRQDSIDITIDPWGEREKYYHFIYGPVENSFYDETFGFITDPLDPRYGKPDKDWSGEWEYKNFISKGKWTSFIKIPFKTLGVEAPVPGTTWTGNVGRMYIIPDKVNEGSVWSPSIRTTSSRDKDSTGEFKFE